MKHATGLLASAAVLLAGQAAWAQSDYPTRSIEIMVGFSPGGNLDTLARAAQPFLEEYLDGAEISVVNVPGAGGTVMNQRLANAEPDGYTLGLLSMPGVVTVLFGGDADYEIDDYEYSGTFTFEPHSVMMGADTPYETGEDLLEAAREAPGTITIGGAGVGSAAHLAVKSLERAADVSFNFIPAQGAAEMTNQVLGGHIAGGVTTISGSYSYHQEGQARVLGVLANERVEVAPDIPTFAEFGAEVEWGALRGIAAPAGTPQEIVDKLTDAVRQTLEDPEFQEIAARNQMILEFRDGAGFRASVEEIFASLEEMWAEEPWVEQ